MSLILDALRKSEAERRRGQSPDLYGTSASSSAPRRDALRHWPILAGGALVLVAVALLFWPHASPDIDAGTPAGAGAAATGAATPADAAPTPSTPMPIPAQPPRAPTPSTAAHVPLATPRAPTDLAAGAPSPTATAPVAPPAPAQAQAPTPAPVSVEAPPRDDLPTLAILAPGERAALPPLKLSMHVWNSDPGQRFAIVDGQRLTEGATIGGAVVAEIRRDGVVLDVNGRRVLLPRP